MPIVLTFLVGLALLFVAWGWYRQRHRGHPGAVPWTQDDLLVGALILAAFALGVFLTYGLFATGTW